MPGIHTDVFRSQGVGQGTVCKPTFSGQSNYQASKIEQHLEKTDDDYIPFMFPWYGTGVVPSALGCSIAFEKGLDPAVAGKVINEPQDIKRLTMPDPYEDGLMPKVLACIDYMVENTDMPVSFTDAQGPLNIALGLCGVENFFAWMYEYPKHVHEIMDFCTEVLISWLRVQKKHAGQKMTSGAFPHGIVLPEGFGGVWISDDDCTVISPRLYEEFVVPYNSRVFRAFGGGSLHFCGNAEHQLENFSKIDGLTAINNFCMGNFNQIVKMQQMYNNKLPIMVCDFTPLHIEQYYSELVDAIKFKGIILATYVAPDYALVGGKYDTVARDVDQITEESKEVIFKLVHRRSP
ncbi:Uroporphyrinogen decarboxylase [Acididesulfobacillus acetoxydans]|uniref:Uroporphyrinogen decarboxylase n=2 Tax=Acididesulfobacillus acetoxydans TaxID=1561005 RepID=A0A8S0W817_9FIRM|nr:uroporphyrinogen decarboxylase family protein [Acididesulfobacillus acetoxydans]CAA7601389.1 Uroporphyrinogen decarboxylase [Acididesulfobacillus acetoxydans]